MEMIETNLDEMIKTIFQNLEILRNSSAYSNHSLTKETLSIIYIKITSNYLIITRPA
jgi:hypothetical protein